MSDPSRASLSLERHDAHNHPVVYPHPSRKNVMLVDNALGVGRVHKRADLKLLFDGEVSQYCDQTGVQNPLMHTPGQSTF